MAYADKRDGKLTGSFVGEAPKLGKKRRFKTLQDAKDYETFCKLMGREPPTIEDGMGSTGAPTFAQVTEQAKAAGGPKGKWLRQRDRSLMQRLDYCVGIIGPIEIQRVDRAALKRISDSLDKRPASPGRGHDASRTALSNATKNRYMAAAHAVLTYAHNEGLIPHVPHSPLLDEKADRRERDILQLGQDEVILRLMREAGATVEALCAEVLIDTGLRSGELLRQLSPTQITIETVADEDGTNVDVGVLRLTKAQTKNNSARLVIFDAGLAKEIRALMAAGKLPDGDRLLTTFKDACERAGYAGNLVIHSLRHTRNTRLRKAGVEKKMRKQLLGHMSDEANDIYDHTDLQDQLEVVKKVREYAGKRASGASSAAPQVLDFPRKSAG